MNITPKTENLTLSQQAEFIALVTTFSVIIGVCYKVGFYQSKGVEALWILQLFNPSDFIKANLEVYGFYTVAALYMAKVFDQKIEERSLEFTVQGVIMIFLAIFFYFSIDYPLVFYGYIFFSFLAFYLVLYRKLVGKSIGILILLFIPWHMGGSAIENVGGINKLPTAILEEVNSPKTWYLLDQYSDKAILISNGIEKNDFKIIDLKDIKYIENNSK
ncbi:hypothetical protein [uncultured Acinetobacter sp.]|uniref:hypothetical protein n=1 Tax=uncultured Acinetobacter sp. TaxID=165433 RepID=UPI00260A90F3|nr:hypothetical protein [uncultured Acinetobacter sp.]